MKDTKEKLLKSAAKLFAQKGFSAASVRQIVQRAGVNICAVHYHFGDKYGLYLATVKYLMEETNKQIFRPCQGGVLPEDLDKLSYAQALAAFRHILERFLDLGFKRKNILLERIFTYAELESSQEFRRVLLSDTTRFHRTFFGLLSILTGLKRDSTELILLGNIIFGQVNQSDFTRFAVCRMLHLKKYTPAVCTQIKQLVWQNTYAILKEYKRGKKDK